MCPMFLNTNSSHVSNVFEYLTGDAERCCYYFKAINRNKKLVTKNFKQKSKGVQMEICLLNPGANNTDNVSFRTLQ